MKRLAFAGVCLALTCSLCHAQEFKVGAHAAYTLGADVDKPRFGLGAHASAPVNDALSLELSLTWVPEDYQSLDGVTALALSGRYEWHVAEGVALFAGGGPSVGIFGSDKYDVSVGYHLGGGTELLVGNLFEVIADVRLTALYVPDLKADTFYSFGLVRIGASYPF